MKRTWGTETSKYPEEKKSTELTIKKSPASLFLNKILVRETPNLNINRSLLSILNIIGHGKWKLIKNALVRLASLIMLLILHN